MGKPSVDNLAKCSQCEMDASTVGPLKTVTVNTAAKGPSRNKNVLACDYCAEHFLKVHVDPPKET